jgi:flagellar basal-body rod protein FlgG
MTIRALSTAATGMTAQMRNIDVIANNIANVTTTGFKKQSANFEDLFYQELNIAGGPAGGAQANPIGSQIGTGVRLVGTQRSFMQGAPKETQQPFDIMVEGDGFFEVQLPSGGTAYTRNGNFHMDSDGNLVTSDGYRLEPNITIPNQAISVSISQDGVVKATMSDMSVQDCGQIRLSTFVNPEGLSALGDCLFAQTAASGPATTDIPTATGFGRVRQGSLEQSNVDVVRELVAMIEGQRAYEINANSIKTADNMLQVANNLRA